MSKKLKILSIFLIISSTVILFITISSNTSNFASLLKAEVNGNLEETNEVLIAARNYAIDNIDSLKEDNIITIKELVREKYLSGDEINPSTKEKYNEKTRVFIKIKDNEIVDIYMMNNLFKNVFSCENVCYPQTDNYVGFNNDIYQIIKIDQSGNIYITNNEIENTYKDKIDSTLKNIYNSLDKDYVINVVSLTKEDIIKSNINIENNIVVNSNDGYKLYDIDNNNEIEINSKRVNILPIIVLKNNITYEKGNGSKFDPYVLGE